uniref:Uncharacterized protein n=1 Tax=Panagrolaimus sp. JU765 TaxID=591449 RepID=A0AC34RCY8_9BILA
MFKEMSEAEVLKLFQTCQINSWLSADDFFGAENKYWTPEFEKACFDSTRCLNSLTISFKKRGEAKCLKFYQNLQCLKILHVTHYVSNVSLLPRLPPAIFIGTPFLHSANDDSPDLLINLAQKTKDFPLSYFCSKIRFAPSDVQQFLQNGVFYGQCSFIFHIDPEEHDSFEEIFTSFGARKSSVSGFRIPALDSDKNVAEFSVLLTY